MSFELDDWLFLAAVPRLGTLRLTKLLQNLSATEIRNYLAAEPQVFAVTPGDLCEAQQRMEQAYAWQQAGEARHIISRADPCYPPLLQQIPDPPAVLFVKGQVTTLLLPAVAIVGSRSASRSGLTLAYRLATELSHLGVAIISGMAAGIDGAAHGGALSQQGATVAVLGTGVEQVYPASHRQLYQHIQQQGAVISEFWPQTKAYAGNFPKRNRIISGIAMGTVVVEARRRSGSLITARTAMEQGREVFAVPGPVLGEEHQGCHDLIKNGAKLVENAADIMEELAPLASAHLQRLPPHSRLPSQDNCELPFKTLLASVGYEITPLDVVVEQSGITLELVLEQLLELELQGWVAAVPGGYVRLKRS